MKYTPLFTIEIEHDFYVSVPQLFRILPTKDTEIILRGAGLVTKFFQNKLFVLVRHLEADRPSLNLTNDFTLQFFLEVVGSDFTQITNYSNPDPYNMKVYLSNAKSIIDGNDKEVGDVLYLNEKLPQFNVTNAYKYNDLVCSGSNTSYECLGKIDANTGNLNNGSQFRQLGKVSYISPSSHLLFTGQEKTIALKIPAAEVDISYFKYDPVASDFVIEVKNTVIGADQNPSGEDIERVSLNFNDDGNIPFPEGIYKIILNTLQVELMYFRPENDWHRYLGLINIHNNSMADIDKYRFLKTDGSFFTTPPDNEEIDTRNFKIRFAPAQYLLKYSCRSNKVTDIDDDDGVIEFDSLGNSVFQSKLPVRMSEKSIDTITVTYDGSEDLKKTKVPGYRDLSLTDDENKYIVSETFLNL